MRLSILVAIGLTVLIASVIAAIRMKHDNLSARFDLSRRAVLPERGRVLTESDISELPELVRRYLYISGAIGRPITSSVHVTFDASLFQSPTSPAMNGSASQIDALDPPRRLFFMETRMHGLPVSVLHEYQGTVATMRVRVVGLFDVVNASGPELSRTETVTLLNDICLFMPSALVRREFSWKSINDSEAEVVFTNGPYAVAATLTFDSFGHLVNFSSDDRGELQKDGILKRERWTTPVKDFVNLDGRVVPTYGEAVWHRAEGEFTYGKFSVKKATFDAVEK